MPLENKISVCPFSQAKFIEIVCPPIPSQKQLIPEQVKYLARYCERLGVRTLVHESHYMDRHYIDEYAFYYSRMLSPPPNSVRRLHFFAREFDDSQFNAWLERSLRSPSEREAVEAELMSMPDGSIPNARGYLGHCAIRPIASVPIGRTVIARLHDNEGQAREIFATSPHPVHLANLKLRVDGLAFQQQDAAVGACATAALWTALVRVARLDGIRAPTPAEISDVATQSLRVGARPLLTASTGLTINQLCQATRALGFTPEVISARGRPEAFMLALHTYLMSGIPLVLALRGSGVGHAVTAVGLQTTPSEHPLLQGTFRTRSSRVKKVYVHDDRMGPYARAYIEPFPHNEDVGDGLLFEIEWEGSAETEKWIIDCAIAPVYPKLRLPVRSLVTLAELNGAIVEALLPAEQATKLCADFRYQRSGEYLTKLPGRIHDPVRGASFVRRVVFPRWCAVIRWSLDEKELVEFVYDTTDVVRDALSQNRELLRAIVCLSPEFFEKTEKIGEALRVPVV